MNVNQQRKASTVRRVWMLVGPALLFFIGTGLISGCGKKEVSASSASPPPMPVSVIKIEPTNVPIANEWVGTMDGYVNAQIQPQVAGYLIQQNYREGALVRRNDVLFKIDPRPFQTALRQAEAQNARDTAARSQAQAQERRYKELLEKNFISKDAYSQYQTNAQTANAVAEASKAAVETARLNLEYCTIRSPIDGFAGKIQIQIGNLVKANDVNALVVVNQVHPVLVTFAVPEQQLATLRKYNAEQPLAVEATIPGANRPPATGELSFIDNAVDPTTGTIRLRGVFENADNALWPGQFVNVSVRLYDQVNAIVIPSQAIQNGPDGEYVFVVTPNLVAEMRPVKIDRSDGQTTVLASGVKAGEQVVVRGQLKVTTGSRVKLES